MYHGRRRKRRQGDNLFVRAAVSDFPTTKCGLIPQHFYHLINAAVAYFN